MTLITDGKTDFIQSPHDRYRDHCNGTLPSGRETGLNSKYNMGKGQFVTKEQVRSQWLENYQEETSGEAGFYLNLPNRILC